MNAGSLERMVRQVRSSSKKVSVSSQGRTLTHELGPHTYNRDEYEAQSTSIKSWKQSQLPC